MAQPKVTSDADLDSLFIGDSPSSVPAAPATGAAAGEPDLDSLFIGDSPSGRASAPASPWTSTDEAASGLLLGGGPYVKAAGHYLATGGRNPFGAEVQKAKEDQALYEEQNPLGHYLSLATSVAPVAAATALMPEIEAPALFGRAAPMVGRVASGLYKGAAGGVLDTGVTGGDVGTNALVGAGVGAAFPLLGAGISAALKPEVESSVAAAAREAQAAGLTTLRPGQYARTGTFWNKADKVLMAGRDTPQLKQYTRLLNNSMGITSDTTSADLITERMSAIGKELDDVASKTRLSMDPTLNSKLNNVTFKITSASGLDETGMQRVQDVIENIRDSTLYKTGKVSGQAFQQLVQEGSMLAKLGSDSNASVREAAGEISDSLFENMARYTPDKDQVKRLFDLKDQYKNALALRGPASKVGPSGLLNPSDVAAVAGKGGGAPTVQALGSVGKLLPKPDATGASGPLPGHKFFSPSFKVGLSAGIGSTLATGAAIQEAKEVASMAVAHPFLTAAAAGASILAGGARPLTRTVLGSPWLNKLALGLPQEANPFGAALARTTATGLLNQR